MHPTETAINDYVDGTSDPFERNAVETHLTTCVACRQLVDDLREITRATGALELREPPVRAWGRIARAITLEQGNDAEKMASEKQGPYPFFGEANWRKRGMAPYWLAAAAALILATLVGLRYIPGRTQPGGDDDGVETSASARQAAEAIESELRLAESHYENAIKGLEAAANSDQDALDPRTAATLQKNLAVIDQAISESRAAMRAQPASEPAKQSLIENFKTKIALLQDTVALINEMRKGNEAGAARIVSGLKQKG
jgi:anti-sigma factor RsiW